MYDCWPWFGKHRPDGRPILYLKQSWSPPRALSARYVYRITWEMGNGQVPEGYELHHACHNKWCIRPDHLELMTKADHTREHKPRRRKDVSPTCPQGHEYTEESTGRRTNGQRYCRTCHREYARRRRRRLRGLTDEND